MLSLPIEKIDALFEAIASKENLYIPVDRSSGKSNFHIFL